MKRSKIPASAIRILRERGVVGAASGPTDLSEKYKELIAPIRSAYDVYADLDLGPGGDAAAPARAGRDAVAAAIRKKHRR